MTILAVEKPMAIINSHVLAKIIDAMISNNDISRMMLYRLSLPALIKA